MPRIQKWCYLALSAPIDALYAATELNEAALERTSAILAGKEHPALKAACNELLRTIREEQNHQLM